MVSGWIIGGPLCVASCILYCEFECDYIYIYCGRCLTTFIGGGYSPKIIYLFSPDYNVSIGQRTIWCERAPQNRHKCGYIPQEIYSAFAIFVSTPNFCFFLLNNQKWQMSTHQHNTKSVFLVLVINTPL